MKRIYEFIVRDCDYPLFDWLPLWIIGVMDREERVGRLFSLFYYFV